MDVLAFGTLRENVGFRVDLTTRNLGKLGSDIEGKSAEVANINGLSLAEVLVKVSGKGLPDDKHLCLLLKGFLGGVGAFSRGVVHTGEVATFLDNPVANVFNF